jgi:hypothetical protein
MSTDNTMIVYVMFNDMVIQAIIWLRVKKLQKLQQLQQLNPLFVKLLGSANVTLTL